jgi:hypothetical protein
MRTIKTHIRFAGLKRTGNHAVLNWLISQFNGAVCFRNNVRLFGRPGIVTCDPINAFSQVTKRQRVSLDDDLDKSLVVFTYEDQELNNALYPEPFEAYSQALNHHIEKMLRLVVVRDPYNYIASRVKAEENGNMQHVPQLGTEQGRRRLFQLWRDYAEWSLREDFRPGEVAVSYNDWLLSASYRKELCVRLGVPLVNDEARRAVSHWGLGSSFVGIKREADKCYLERWRLYRDHPAMTEFLADELLTSLSDQLFGTILSSLQVRQG